MSVLVAVSNNGGGITRHLEHTSSVVDFGVAELPERLSLPAKMRTLRARLRDAAPGILVTHGMAAGLAARHRGRTSPARHVEFWHNDPFFLAPRRRIAYRLLASTGRPPDLQVFVNSMLISMYGDTRSRSVVIPNAVPTQPHRPSSVSRSGVRTAVYLGRLSPEKGYQDLLDAWPQDAAAGWRLDIYGEGPLESNSLPRGAHLRGQSTQPLAVLASADLLVVPSRIETGPYVALEAASLAVPLVATSTGDMPGLVSSGCGWATPPQDVAALHGALREALGTSPEDLAHMGDQGRRWVEDERPFASWQQAIRLVYEA